MPRSRTFVPSEKMTPVPALIFDRMSRCASVTYLLASAGLMYSEWAETMPERKDSTKRPPSYCSDGALPCLDLFDLRLIEEGFLAPIVRSFYFADLMLGL